MLYHHDHDCTLQSTAIFDNINISGMHEHHKSQAVKQWCGVQKIGVAHSQAASQTEMCWHCAKIFTTLFFDNSLDDE